MQERALSLILRRFHGKRSVVDHLVLSGSVSLYAVDEHYRSLMPSLVMRRTNANVEIPRRRGASCFFRPEWPRASSIKSRSVSPITSCRERPDGTLCFSEAPTHSVWPKPRWPIRIGFPRDMTSAFSKTFLSSRTLPGQAS